jgi:hypothetical protein
LLSFALLFRFAFLHRSSILIYFLFIIIIIIRSSSSTGTIYHNIIIYHLSCIRHPLPAYYKGTSNPNSDNFMMSETDQNAPTTAQSGINIQDALSILSSRAKNGGEKDALQAATPELKKLGQTLDLMNTQQWTRPGQTGEDCCIPDDVNSTDEPKPKILNDESKSDGEKGAQQQQNDDAASNSDIAASSRLQKELSKLSPAEQIGKLFELQKSRVAVYRQFNDGLEDVLTSGNLTSYPHLATSVTASFTVISRSIRDIQALMEARVGNDNNGDISKNVVKFIKQLQEIEKEKLNLTAALHLEIIRERNEKLDLESRELNANGSEDKAETISRDDRVLMMLREGVSGLQGKIRDLVEQINDVLEELRYASHDLME